jgi:rare lipoprotein A
MRRLMVLVAAAALLTGCAHHTKHVAPPPAARRAPAAIPVPIGHTEEGVASWYGNPYHGRRAASGEIYDMEQMTAAHRTMPFNTWVRVYNLDNGRTTDVRITDRGPFVEGRIVDLSHAAARALNLIGPGVARVRLEVIRAPDPPVTPATPVTPVTPVTPSPLALFAVQVGAFRDRDNAERVRAAMEARYGKAQIVERAADPPLWRVLVGAEESEAAAQRLADRIRRESDENSPAFIVRIDTTS